MPAILTVPPQLFEVKRSHFVGSLFPPKPSSKIAEDAQTQMRATRLSWTIAHLWRPVGQPLQNLFEAVSVPSGAEVSENVN